MVASIFKSVPPQTSGLLKDKITHNTSSLQSVHHIEEWSYVHNVFQAQVSVRDSLRAVVK